MALMVDNRVWFISPNTPARVKLFINSVTLHSYDVANVTDDDDLAAAALESFFNSSSLQVT